MTRETVEARITTLHTRLGITPDEEIKWTAVAQVMRDNESDMQRLISERRSAAPHDVTAVEDLKTYEHFTQAHVNGLKNLISSFEVLYSAMPAPQQAVADHVFMSFGKRSTALKS
jgi:leucyl aminopeptidase (aminopeptidase T)